MCFRQNVFFRNKSAFRGSVGVLEEIDNDIQVSKVTVKGLEKLKSDRNALNISKHDNEENCNVMKDYVESL